MSIACITAAWKRPRVFKAFLKHTRSICPEIYCAGSPSDQCAGIASRYGIHYERVLNVMSDKWNHAVQMSKASKATHFLFMGSDDFMDAKMFGYYEAYKGPHLALLDLLFMDSETRQLAYWPGYRGKRQGEPIGAAKLVRRDVLEAMNWTPFVSGRHRSLDYDMNQGMEELGIKVDVVSMKDTGGICIDVKSQNSLTAMRTILKQPGVQVLDSSYLSTFHPDMDKATTLR